MEQAKKPWLLLVLSALVLHLSGASSEAVSTGEEESPWLWVSSESRAPQSEAGEHVIEVVDYVEDRHALASHADPRSEPRFIGNLKRKLCRVGLGLGCTGGRDKSAYPIEPQDINYVQPLVIQAVGKPIPAIPAENKKDKSRKEFIEKPEKPEETPPEAYNLFNNNKYASQGSLNPQALAPLNNQLQPNSFGIKGSETGYSPMFLNPGGSIYPNNYGDQNRISPPAAVFKSPRPQLLDNMRHEMSSPYLALSSNIQTNTFPSNPFPLGQTFQHQSSFGPNISPLMNSFSDQNNGIIKADLLNSLKKIKPQTSFNTIPNFSTKGIQIQQIHPQGTPNFASLLQQSNNFGSGTPQSQQPNIIKLSSPQNPPKIKILNITSRPKKEALASVATPSPNSKSLENEEGKVIKHIHVHKHIHQMDQDSDDSTIEDNLDSFSTSMFTKAHPDLEHRNSLRSFLSSTKRSKKRQRNIGTSLDDSFANFMMNNIDSCTCVPKKDCPLSMISYLSKDIKRGLKSKEDPRHRPSNDNILSATSNRIFTSLLNGRVNPKNSTENKSLRQIIKPRITNGKTRNSFSPSQKDRKIVLNINRLTKRDVPKNKNKLSKNTSNPAELVTYQSYALKNESENDTKKISNEEVNFNNENTSLSPNEERKIILNIKRISKRDISIAKLLAAHDDLQELHANELPFSCGLHEVCCNLDNYDSSLNHVGISVVPTEHFPSRSTCGRTAVDSIKGRISSGVVSSGEAKFGEFPWQAAILKKEGSDNIYVCAGSLVDKSHVVTAAHCIEGYDASQLRVRLGEWDVNRATEFYAHVEYDVVGVAMHPDFYSGNLINDIALLRMLYPIDMMKHPHISPICLPRRKEKFSGNRCLVSGWGKNSFGKSGKYQNLLKKVDVPVLPRKSCENILRSTRLGLDYTLHPGMMCAGGEPEKDACKGDGGGPLSCRADDGHFVLSGIVSWGIGCGQPGVPGVYVNVQHYVSWLTQMMDS